MEDVAQWMTARDGTFARRLESIERRAYTIALQRANGNLSGAARILGVQRMAFDRKTKRFGVR